MEKFNFELVTPEEILFSSDVQMAIIPGSEGDFGVLPGHAPVISTIKSGIITLTEGSGKEVRAYVTEGFAEVTTERCTVLTQTAVNLEKITLEDARKNLKEAEHNLAVEYKDSAKTKLERRVEIAKNVLVALESR